MIIEVSGCGFHFWIIVLPVPEFECHDLSSPSVDALILLRFMYVINGSILNDSAWHISPCQIGRQIGVELCSLFSQTLNLEEKY